MKTSDAIKIAADEVGIPFEVASKAYYMSWKFIRDKMKELPFREDLTEEQFKELRPNFNIPDLGKFTVSFDKYKRTKKQFEYIEYFKNKVKDDTED